MKKSLLCFSSFALAVLMLGGLMAGCQKTNTGGTSNSGNTSHPNSPGNASPSSEVSLPSQLNADCYYKECYPCNSIDYSRKREKLCSDQAISDQYGCLSLGYGAGADLPQKSVVYTDPKTKQIVSVIENPVNCLVGDDPTQPFFFSRDNKLYRYDPKQKKEELLREEGGTISLLTGGDLTLYYLCGNRLVRFYPPTRSAKTVVTFKDGQTPDSMKAVDNKTLDFTIPTPEYLEWLKTHKVGVDMLPDSILSSKSYQYSAVWGEVYRTYLDATNEVAASCAQDSDDTPENYDAYMKEYYNLSDAGK